MSKRDRERDARDRSALEEPGNPANAGAEDPDAATRREAEALLGELKAELDEAVAARKRALADFANYQRRAAEAERQAVASGAAGVMESLLGVLDHFDLALGQQVSQLTVDQLMGGVQMVRDELLRALAAHGLSRFAPAVGDEFDPARHQAMQRLPAGDLGPNQVAAVFKPGYELNGRILRPAAVAVAVAEDGGASGGGGEGD